MTWLTWRVERTTLLAVAALVGVFALLALTMHPRNVGFLTEAGIFAQFGPGVFATVVAMFWGAPMVARELEHRTHLLVWSRSLSPTRWLLGKLVRLVVPVVLFTVLVDLIAVAVLLKAPGISADTLTGMHAPGFELWIPLQLAMVLAGFGLGVAVGVLTRHSVTAMAVTVVSYVLIRFVVASFVRPHYMAPVQALDKPPSGSLQMGIGFLNAQGQVVDPAPHCAAETSYQACLSANGVARTFYLVQPVDRLDAFRLIETGIYGGVAVLAFAAAWLLIRRRVVL